MNNIICGARRAHPYIKLLAAVLLAAVNSACDKEGFEYNLPGQEQQANYIVADTLTIDMRTLLLDSIPTSGTGVILVGKQQDPYFGTTTAGSFFQLQLPANKELDRTADYDYTELVLYTNRRLYGDSTLPQHINVYEVLQTIEKSDNSAYLYSHNDFLTGAQPLGSIQKVIRPNIDTVVKIRLPDSYGEPLFKLFKDKSTIVAAQATFLKTYRGLALKAGANSGNILSFPSTDTAVILRMHYHNKELFFTDRFLDLNVYNQNLQFNQVLTERSGSLLAPLSAANSNISSTLTDNLSFIKPLTGIVTRINLPTLKNLAIVGKFFKVMRASMVIEPLAGTYRAPFTLPPALTLCEVDRNDHITDTLRGSYGESQYGSLFIDQSYVRNTTYTYDITQYIKNEIASPEVYSRKLMIMPPGGAYYTSLDRVVLGDGKNKKNKISIQVQYLLYN